MITYTNLFWYRLTKNVIIAHIIVDKAKHIRFALVGCGAIANKHVTAIGRLENASICGACDIDPKAAQAFQQKYGIPAYTDAQIMIEETGPHVLNILTPSGLHGDNIMELMKFNRHFVVEKPFALTLSQIDKILEECDKRRIKIFVIKQNRFNPPIVKLKEALDKGRFGKLVLATVRVRWRRDNKYYKEKPWRGTWAYDGGVLTNQASHHIDMLIWLMGAVESVMAKTATHLADIEADDTGVAILKFKNGALGVIEATTAARPKDLEGSVSVLGQKGTVVVGGFFMNELQTWEFEDRDEQMDDDIWENYSKVPAEPAWNHSEFFKDVIESLIYDKQGLVGGIEGRKSVELIHAMYESVETQKEVFLSFIPKRCRLGVIK
ncbi:MAG: Gfo/Idh/MocA family oxidoreductase [Nitrospirae bacterium]|nr:Gfo/Idh/MocA family oxidoreductase [Nitrospirota bacterium]MBF0534102.1 Gfo/Idh/MocA family oxidoreductase [Nitrospirota bacterium]MBF0616989.1 Gfo/Idh/MocA family oxidoreductase [Nitrospirota bacterium]